MTPASFWSIAGPRTEITIFSPEKRPDGHFCWSDGQPHEQVGFLSVTACSRMCGCRHLVFLFALMVVLPLVTAAACSLVFAD
jgi:hypothetical protein